LHGTHAEPADCARQLAGQAEQPCQTVGGERDSERVERPPAFVARKQLRIARIEPEATAFRNDLDQRADVAQADVEALAGDRMEPVRRIANENQPLGRYPCGVMNVGVIQFPGSNDERDAAWAVRYLVVALSALFLLTFGLLLAILALVVWADAENRPAILAGFAFVFLAAGGGGVAYLLHAAKGRDPLFKDTIAVLKGDEQALRQGLRGTGD